MCQHSVKRPFHSGGKNQKFLTVLHPGNRVNLNGYEGRASESYYFTERF